jgi:hypothetical protein
MRRVLSREYDTLGVFFLLFILREVGRKAAMRSAQQLANVHFVFFSIYIK